MKHVTTWQFVSCSSKSMASSCNRGNQSDLIYDIFLLVISSEEIAYLAPTS